ncbi:MAG: adaptor protein MecA [Defluviitaleaceae bacterium]|nr:adaptor protein MecA [Defluviitaleaceae bacterium]MCL2835997.1 adaptor protein MecA [Defluviitaleaceae bacterium]
MKIERISDEQIKFILNKDDLNFHNLKITDLAHGNAKMHELFREMMTQAMVEYEFNTDPNTPLIVETVPLPNDSIMIIVTKAAAQEYIESKFNIQPKAREERKYRRKPFIEPPLSRTESKETPVCIYMFKSLDEIGAAAARLNGSFRGPNSVYKKQNKYYLVLQNENNINKMEHFEAVLMEYGQKHSTSVIYKLHLDEYGEVLVQDSAIDKLADIY